MLPTSSTTVIRTLVVLIAILVPFAANMFLPSLPALDLYFHSADESLELAVASFTLGFGCSQLFYGPLSDRFGRRKILLLGMTIALVGSIGCAMVKTVDDLILCRFILGCGVGVGAALTRAILRDSFDGIALNKAMAQNGVIFAMAPMLAPLLGSLVDKWMGWEANFIFIAIAIAAMAIATWVLLVETNKNLNMKALHPKHIAINYFSLLKHKQFLGYALCAGFSGAGIAAYLTMSSFLFQKTLGTSVVEYGFYTALVTSGLFFGRFINILFIGKWRSNQVILFGIGLMLFAGIIMLIPGLFHIINIPVIIIPVMLFALSNGFIISHASAGALKPFVHITGSASALYGTATLFMSFLASGLIALLPDTTQNYLAVIYIVLGIAALLAFYILLKPVLTMDLEQGEAETLGKI